MDHDDHIRLIEGGVRGSGKRWAELGSGWGAFTLALADLLGLEGQIYSVDRDPSALQRQQAEMQARFPGAAVQYRHADFTHPLDLPLMDGILMANSLHFVHRRRQAETLRGILEYLRPGGRFVLVEYNADRGNLWVPHPLSFTSWQKLARDCDLVQTRQLAAHPARTLNEIYSALSLKPQS
jgi:ubiquinone/menaquinone biosynthesis C-methylase UbiE